MGKTDLIRQRNSDIKELRTIVADIRRFAEDLFEVRAPMLRLQRTMAASKFRRDETPENWFGDEYHDWQDVADAMNRTDYTSNRLRMLYDLYLAAGLPIGVWMQSDWNSLKSARWFTATRRYVE